MLLTVHDSVLVETPVGKIKHVKQLIRETMEEQPPEFDVELKVEIGAGNTWKSCCGV